MQPVARARRTASAYSFQYPRSDRRRCNDSGDVEVGVVLPFQYPRSDRRRCNSGRQKRCSWSASLSVSSVGSEAMQRRGPGAGDCGHPDFQYPRSDRRRCNHQRLLRLVRRPALSVSSVGSEAMQPPSGPSRAAERVNFQYPRSDRRRCNCDCPGSSRRRPRLSVSSVGSEAMQPVRSARRYPMPRSFQYPRSDRRRCNFPPNYRDTASSATFSILGRIGGDATPQWCGIRQGHRELSVSSVGSEAMQHIEAVKSLVSLISFQYPRSDRRRCNRP